MEMRSDRNGETAPNTSKPKGSNLPPRFSMSLLYFEIFLLSRCEITALAVLLDRAR
jgi:hypothetical protein